MNLRPPGIAAFLVLVSLPLGSNPTECSDPWENVDPGQAAGSSSSHSTALIGTVTDSVVANASIRPRYEPLTGIRLATGPRRGNLWGTGHRRVTHLVTRDVPAATTAPLKRLNLDGPLSRATAMRCTGRALCNASPLPTSIRENPACRPAHALAPCPLEYAEFE
jgi:hypothetical protein